MHAYHDTTGAFAPAYYAPPPTGTPNTFFAWSALILPYIEQGNLYQQLNPTQVSLQTVIANNLPLVQTRIKTYICPSDDGPNPNTNRPFNNPTDTVPPAVAIGTSNYVGNNGHANGVGVFIDNNARPRISTPIGIADIPDGTSNTLMVGERTSTIVMSGQNAGVSANPPVAPCNPIVPIPRSAALWAGYQGWGPAQPLQGPTDIWSFCVTHLYQIQTGDSFMGCNINFPKQSASSAHPGGIQYVMCDGSVQFVKNDINWTFLNQSSGGVVLPIGTLNRLSQRHDGLPIGGDF